jgi:DNA-binding transcriptional MerR regulator
MENQKQHDENKLLTIKEVAASTGLPPSTIRYYDQQFAEFLGIKRGAGRRRMFETEAVERLVAVHGLLKDRGLSLRQARQALGGEEAALAAGSAPSQEVAELAAEVARLREEVETLERKMRDLKEIQQRTLALVDGLTRG